MDSQLETGIRWWIRYVVVPVIGGGGLLAILLSLILPNSTQSPPPRTVETPGPKTHPTSPIGQQLTTRIYYSWVNKHPEISEQYGQPKTFKFVNLHEQHFKTGYIAYNVTDGWSVLLYRLTKQYRKLPNPGVHLTPGSGRIVNEKLFDELTRDMSDVDRRLYRGLIDKRVNSADFQGIGIIGGIGTLYIKERLYRTFGQPEENEKLIRNVLYVTGDKYEVLLGLPHGLGGPSPEEPKSIYILYRDGRYERHVEFPDS